MKKWMYLPIEGKVRELHSKLLFAYFAMKQGYSVVIGEHRAVEAVSTVYPEGIFFSKGYPKRTREKVIRGAAESGHRVVELDEEGLLIKHIPNYLNSRMSLDLLSLVAEEYCWGRSQKQIISKAYPSMNRKCVVAGSLRFDLLHPKFRPLYKEEAEQLAKKYKEFVLVNTRFPLYNGSQRIRHEDSHPTVAIMKELYFAFIELVQSLAATFPEKKFILRPHPAENLQTYRQALSSFKNVHVIHEGNIIPWLLTSEAVIQNGCTSSIEAFLAGKPVISYTPVTNSRLDIALPNEVGMIASDVSTVAQLLLDIRNESPTVIDHHLQARLLLKDFYDPDKKEFAHQTILQSLEKLPHPVPTRVADGISYFTVRESEKLIHLFPSLQQKEVEDFFVKMNHIEETSEEVTINRIGKKVFTCRISS